MLSDEMVIINSMSEGLLASFQPFWGIAGLVSTPTNIQFVPVNELLSKSEQLCVSVPPGSLRSSRQLLKGSFWCIYYTSFLPQNHINPYFPLKWCYLNVISVTQILTNFRLLIKRRMSQPVSFDAESSIRCSVVIKCGFDLKWDNNEAPSEEDWHALACSCSWVFGLWLAGCC